MEIIEIQINSVSKGIYKANGVVLSCTDSTRTLFVPMITPKGVDGTILYEKKNSSGDWVTATGISKSNVKKGEWTKVILSTSELSELIRYVSSLEEFRKTGLLDAFHHYLIAGLFSGLADDEIEKIKTIIGKSPDVLRRIIEINDRTPDLSANEILSILSSNYGMVSELIQKADFATANNLRLATKIRLLNIEELENLINSNSDEESFQRFFISNPEILSLVVPSLIHCIQDKPYYGGKDLTGNGGTFGDFLYKERNNFAFVEIKTPSCRLIIDRDYRNGIKELSNEICNAVVQVKHEKDVFYKHLAGDSKYEGSFFDCKCYVIAGLSSSLTSEEAVASFELFKASLNNVSIITYDEIVDIVRRIAKVLSE